MRKGQVNFAIGSLAFLLLQITLGNSSFKNELFLTEIATIDEIASAAELVMEKSIDIPMAIIRDLNTNPQMKMLRY